MSPSAAVTAEKFTLYMGRDKIENEELIRFGWPQDVWFHVDNLSSAHVYLRMEEGMTIKQIPPRTRRTSRSPLKSSHAARIK